MPNLFTNIRFQSYIYLTGVQFSLDSFQSCALQSMKFLTSRNFHTFVNEHIRCLAPNYDVSEKLANLQQYFGLNLKNVLQIVKHYPNCRSMIFTNCANPRENGHKDTEIY